jgi:lambda repressor-like predicted transcriptional regulator
MHHEDIKAELRKRGVKPADVAKHLLVSQETVSKVIRGQAKSRRVADAVAKIVGHSVLTLWPGLYEPKPAPDLTRLLGASSARKQRAKAAA